MRDFRNLQIWEKAHSFTLDVDKSIHSFPKDELYGLTCHIRCSSSSFPADFAEVCGRNGDAELVRFISIGMDSASELEYQLLLVPEHADFD